MKDLYFNLYALDLDDNRFLIRTRVLGWEYANYIAREMRTFPFIKDVTIEASDIQDDRLPPRQ